MNISTKTKQEGYSANKKKLEARLNLIAKSISRWSLASILFVWSGVDVVVSDSTNLTLWGISLIGITELNVLWMLLLFNVAYAMKFSVMLHHYALVNFRKSFLNELKTIIKGTFTTAQSFKRTNSRFDKNPDEEYRITMLNAKSDYTILYYDFYLSSCIAIILFIISLISLIYDMVL